MRPRAVTTHLALLGALVVALGTSQMGAAQSPASCGPAPVEQSIPPSAPLTVLAAASLAGPFSALEAPWEARHPGSTLLLSFDASSAQRAQIEQGAPADVLAAADRRDPQLLLDACLASGGLVPFARNRLALVTPLDDPGGVATPADLGRPGLRMVMAAPEVPIARYASQVVANLAALSGNPDGFAAAVAANTASEEDNARAVLARVELGEADAAFVYATDAAASELVRTVPFPEEANVEVTYVAVAVRAAPQPALASDFVAFLTEPLAASLLQAHGLLPPR